MKKIIFLSLLMVQFVGYCQNSGKQNLFGSTDDEKINYSLRFAQEHLQDSTKQAQNYLKTAINLAEKNHIISDSIAKATYLLAESYYQSQNLDSTLKYIDNSIRIASIVNNQKLLTKSYYIKANLFYYSNKYLQADEIFTKVYKQANKLKDTLLVVQILIDKAYNHDMMSEKQKAINLLEKAIAYSKKINYLTGIGRSEVALGNIYFGIDNYKQARQHYQAALEAAKRVNNIYGMSISYKNIGDTFLEEHNTSEALKYLQQAYKLIKNTNNQLAVANYYNDFALVYSYKKQKDSVQYYLNKSRNITFDLGADEEKSVYYNVAGEAYKNLKEYYKSNKYLDTCISYAKKMDYKLMLEKTYKLYSENLYQQRKFDKAYLMYKNFNNVKDSISTESFKNKLAQYQVKYKTLQKESEINRLKDKEIINETRKKLLIALLISLAIIFFSVLAWIQNRRKIEKRVNQLKIKEAELKKQEMENTLEANERQLTGFTLHMMQKNLILKDLLDYIKNVEKDKITNIGSKIREFKIKIINALSSDQDWKTFEVYFEKANPKFIKRLKEKHPNLTAKEVKLAIMVRLNMDIKETASTMNIEPNSVRIARYRLRKKLGLSSNDNLHEYMLGV